MKFKTIIEDTETTFDVNYHSSGIHISLNGKSVDADIQKISNHTYSIILDGKSHIISLIKDENPFPVLINQKKSHISVKDETQILLDSYGFIESEANHAGEIQAPIPGLVTKIFVSKDDIVKKNQRICILEAMKMENEIDSPISGKITKVLVEEGDAVDKGQLILHIDAD